MTWDMLEDIIPAIFMTTVKISVFFANDEKVIAYFHWVYIMLNTLILYIKVRPVTVSQVLQQDPFLLVYELCGEHMCVHKIYCCLYSKM